MVRDSLAVFKVIAMLMAVVVIAYIGTLLSKQKKQDYRPKDDEVRLTTLQTPTCLSVCAFLQKVHSTATESLDGANLEGFLNEIGTGLRGFLLEHLKKFQVNQAGGIMLSKYVPSLRKNGPILIEIFAEGYILCTKGILPNTVSSLTDGGWRTSRIALSC